jgi:hypothetical protein
VEKDAVTSGDTTGPVLTNANAPPSQWCHLGWFCFDFSHCTGFSFPPACTGEAQLSGSVEDNSPGAFGIASEVADVTLTITTSSDPNFQRVYHFSGTRRGTQAFYGWNLHLKDFPSGTTGTTYDWSVQAVDAAGNPSNTATGSFTVFPI